jgi:hypothetical protein
VAQAIALREQAKAGRLRFSVYLPPGLAEWMLGLLENETFVDPSEAVFVLLQEAQELNLITICATSCSNGYFRRRKMIPILGFPRKKRSAG